MQLAVHKLQRTLAPVGQRQVMCYEDQGSPGFGIEFKQQLDDALAGKCIQVTARLLSVPPRQSIWHLACQPTAEAA